MKDEFKVKQDWFNKKTVRVDLGFIGIQKNYNCKNVEIPHKKSKNKPLTRLQKDENKSYSSKRVVVENALSGLKRFYILSNKLRLHDIDLYNKVLGCCAALWNFKIS